MAAKTFKNRRGQAAIELGLTLTFLIWLLYYTLNAYHSIHTAHVGQKFAAMNLYQRLSFRSKFVVDDVASRLHGKDFMAVEYTDEKGQIPRRRILLEPVAATEIRSTIGICKEPNCR